MARCIALVLLCALVHVTHAEEGWLKGQTHLHSNHSGDGFTRPAEVVRWYEEHGYDFIVFTDHEYVTHAAGPGSLLIIPGAELTQNLDLCEPAPEPGTGCRLHVNGLFLNGPPGPVTWPPQRSSQRLALYQRALDLVARRGGLAQLNHPNYHWAADAALVTELARRGAVLLEVANESGDCQNQGDASHQSAEALWDAALSAGATVYGVATDDAHHYYDADQAARRGEAVYTGDHGFVMVKARREIGTIRRALMSGAFYASTGVLLREAGVRAGALEIAVAEEATGTHQFTFIGNYGRVLYRATGRAARLPLPAVRGGYLRAVVTDASGRRAYVQPVRVPR